MTKYIISTLCAICFILTGCIDSEDITTFEPETGSNTSTGGQTDTTTTSTGESATGSGKTSITTPTITLSDSYSDGTVTVDGDDDDYVDNSSFTSSVSITFDGTTATVDNTVANVTVTAENADIVINSEAKGVEYILSGIATDGSVKIYSSNKFKLTLNGANITSKTRAAINIQSSKRVFFYVADGTTNTLEDSSDYTVTTEDEDMKSCIFSEGQLVFSGSGSLSVTGKYKHAICSDEYIRIMKNTNITVKEAVKDGIHTNEYFVQDGGTVKISSVGDGIEVEDEEAEDGDGITINSGQLEISVTGAASKGLKSARNVNILGGTQVIKTSGAAKYDSDENDISSSSCIKCDGDMTFQGSKTSLASSGSAGKGISVDGSLTINSGTLYVTTTGKQYVYGSLDSSPKGIKAEGDLIINDGNIISICSGGEGSEGIESKSALTINGGTIETECYDDCINSAGALTINGGSIYCYSSNNDAIDSNSTLTITGGLIIAAGTTAPEGGFDCDNNTFKITGGTLLGIGGSTSTPSSSSTQRSVIYNGSANAATLITFINADSKAIMTYDVPDRKSVV